MKFKKRDTDFYEHRVLKILRLLLSFFIITIPLSSVAGDLLLLKSGEVWEGFFLREYKDKFIFQTIDGKKHVVLSKRVQKLEIGLPGMPGCYRLKDGTDDKICGILLIGIGKENILIARDKGFRKTSTVDREDIADIELHYGKSPHLHIPFLKKGYQAKIETASTIFRGEIISYGRRSVRLKNQKGKLRSFTGNRIKKLTLFFEEESGFQKSAARGVPEYQEELNLWWSLIPGAIQFQRRAYTKGILLSLGTVITLTGLTWEHLQAVEAGRDQEADFEEQRAIFDRHEVNKKRYAWGVAVLYSLNLLDAFWGRGSKTSAGLGIKSKNTNFSIMFSPYRQNNSDEIRLRFGLSRDF